MPKKCACIKYLKQHYFLYFGIFRLRVSAVGCVYPQSHYLKLKMLKVFFMPIFNVDFEIVFLDLSRRVFSSRLGVSSISYLKLKMWQVLFVAQTHKPELWKFKLETNSLKNCGFVIIMQ